jgi:putative restriction endonuclease
VERLIELRAFVLEEQKKGDSSPWVREEIPVSYLRDGYCSAALSQLIEFLPAHHHTQEVLRRFEDHEGPESAVAEMLDWEPEVPDNLVHDPNSKDGQDRIREAKVRIGQRAFREIILKVYQNRCCLTGLDIPTINRASHIIGWAERKSTRMDPRNGLCLSATYDAAFDKHLITLDGDYRLVLSQDLQEYNTRESFQKHFVSLSGKRITLPHSYRPSQEYLDIHRKAGSF